MAAIRSGVPGVDIRFQPRDLADLESITTAAWFRAYQDSNLAVMLFGFELDRRLRERHPGVLSVVAHPGSAPAMFTPDRSGVHLGRAARLWTISEELTGLEFKL